MGMVFSLERCTIPAEYFLMMPLWMNGCIRNQDARFIRDKQDFKHGGWPLYYGGAFDINAPLSRIMPEKVGDSPDAAHMVRAREAILNVWRQQKQRLTRLMRPCMIRSVARRTCCAF